MEKSKPQRPLLNAHECERSINAAVVFATFFVFNMRFSIHSTHSPSPATNFLAVNWSTLTHSLYRIASRIRISIIHSHAKLFRRLMCECGLRVIVYANPIELRQCVVSDHRKGSLLLLRKAKWWRFTSINWNYLIFFCLDKTTIAEPPTSLCLYASLIYVRAACNLILRLRRQRVTVT